MARSRARQVEVRRADPDGSRRAHEAAPGALGPLSTRRARRALGSRKCAVRQVGTAVWCCSLGCAGGDAGGKCGVGGTGTAASTQRETVFGRASRTGRVTKAWRSCCRSSRWRMSKGRQQSPRTHATTCSEIGGPRCSLGSEIGPSDGRRNLVRTSSSLARRYSRRRRPGRRGHPRQPARRGGASASRLQSRPTRHVSG